MPLDGPRLSGYRSSAAYRVVREALLTGTAIVVPLVVTVALVVFAFDFVYTWIDTFSDVLLSAPGMSVILPERQVNALLPIVVLLTIAVVGFVANRSESGERAVGYFDAAVQRIPGVGQVYESFREMSTVMLESGVENFQEVKLVEFPTEGTYALGFVTAEPPESVAEATGHAGLVTLFVPLAPNPVMGGHLVYVPREQVVDVDMSVQEGVRSIITMGVAPSGLDESDGLDSEELERLTATAEGGWLAAEASPPDEAGEEGRRR